MGKYLLFLGGVSTFLGIFVLGYVLYSTYEEGPHYKNVTPAPSLVAPEEENISSKIPQNIELYMDFNCPYCRKFYKTSFAPLRKMYKTKIPFHIYHYPLQSEGISLEVAKFYECALEQKNQWDVLDVLYFGYDSFDLEQEDEWIEKLGIEKQPMEICMEEEKTTKKIANDKQRGKEKGVRGTPTVLVNGKKFEGNTAKEILEMEILKAKAR